MQQRLSAEETLALQARRSAAHRITEHKARLAARAAADERAAADAEAAKWTVRDARLQRFGAKQTA